MSALGGASALRINGRQLAHSSVERVRIGIKGELQKHLDACIRHSLDLMVKLCYLGAVDIVGISAEDGGKGFFVALGTNEFINGNSDKRMLCPCFYRLCRRGHEKSLLGGIGRIFFVRLCQRVGVFHVSHLADGGIPLGIVIVCEDEA